MVTARCKELPPDPEHGFVIAPKNDHGSRAKFVCRDGYVIEGDNITTCTYGEWTGAVPRCKIGERISSVGRRNDRPRDDLSGIETFG